MAESRDQRPSGSIFLTRRGVKRERPSSRRHLLAPAFAALLGALLLACAGGAAGTSGRYPEEKRPDAPISASDGKVLGASEQDPSDTLDASLTNEHGAARSPHAEEPAEEAHERLEYDECVQANEAAAKAEAAPGAEPRKRPLCPPPAATKD
jgi:hypothetical protein